MKKNTTGLVKCPKFVSWQYLSDFWSGTLAPWYIEGDRKKVASRLRYYNDSAKEYRKNRENGNNQDSPTYSFPKDGECVWVMEPDGQYARYTEGSMDKAWMEKKDRNYIARLAKEMHHRDLTTVELADFEEGMQRVDIAERVNREARDRNRQADIIDSLRKRSAQSIRKKVLDASEQLDLSQPQEVPKEYLCPIGLELMENPVIMADGHTYEKKNIKRWLEENNCSPLTKEVFRNQSKTPNRALKEAIDRFIERYSLDIPEIESDIKDNLIVNNQDIQPGDILLKHADDSLTNQIITAGSKVQNKIYKQQDEDVEYSITHAAICITKKDELAEASGGGLQICHLVDDHYDWEVFRYKDKGVAGLAKDFAYSLTIECQSDKDIKGTKSGRYAYFNAVRSALVENPKKMPESRCAELLKTAQQFDLNKEKYYCSNFVAFVYALASQIHSNEGYQEAFAIDKDYKVILPTNLYEHLKQNENWQHVGYLNNKPAGVLYPKHHREQLNPAVLQEYGNDDRPDAKQYRSL